MEQTQPGRVKQCGAMFAIAGRLYKRGLITSAEYSKVAAELQEKYRLTASTLGGSSPALGKKIGIPGKEGFSNK